MTGVESDEAACDPGLEAAPVEGGDQGPLVAGVAEGAVAGGQFVIGEASVERRDAALRGRTYRSLPCVTGIGVGTLLLVTRTFQASEAARKTTKPMTIRLLFRLIMPVLYWTAGVARNIAPSAAWRRPARPS